MAWMRSQDGQDLVDANCLWIEDRPGLQIKLYGGSYGDDKTLLGTFPSSEQAMTELDKIQTWINESVLCLPSSGRVYQITRS